MTETLPNDNAAAPTTETAEANVASSTETVTPPSGEVAGLGSNITIDFNAPIESYTDVNPVFRAFNKETNMDLMAVLAPPSSLPRINFIQSFKFMQSPNVLRLVDSGIVDLPAEGREYWAFIYEMPPGPPLLTAWDAKIKPIPEHILLNQLLPSIFEILKEFNASDIVHGAINLRNMYISKIGEEHTAVLGECLSTAPGMTQHVLFEPIERAMAEPQARGLGMAKDDLYAIGVCIGILARGINPIENMSEDEIIKAKIEGGSYALVIGQERLYAGITEFLRGVLNDEPSQRWDFDDVAKWIDGRRLSPRQPLSQLKAARPFSFRDKKYWYLRNLVYAFSQHESDALTALTGSKFTNWFERNFDDKNLVANVETVIERNKSVAKAGAAGERYISEMFIALDPAGPIRFKTHAIGLRGFGNGLAHAYATGRDVQIYAQILNYQLYVIWLSMQLNVPPDAPLLASHFDRARQFLNQKLGGYGLERVAYMRSEHAACLSPKLKRFFVHDCVHLVKSLEKLAAAGQVDLPVFDRHMIAFLSVRNPKTIDPHLSLVNANGKVFQLLGTVKTLAAIQKSMKTGALPHLGDLLIKNSKPAIERVYDRRLKESMEKRVSALKGSGDMGALLEALDNEKMIQDDARKFVEAQAEYAAIESEGVQLVYALQRKKDYGQQKGRQVAMLLAVIVSFIALMINTIAYFAGL
ncbi:MAG: hypothetical protein ACQEQL_08275 [Pseudomonadota bacterium]